jgi:hypothetical protein
MLVAHKLFFMLNFNIRHHYQVSVHKGIEPNAKSLCSALSATNSKKFYHEERDAKFLMCTKIENEDTALKSRLKIADTKYLELAQDSCGNKNDSFDFLKTSFINKYRKEMDFQAACLTAYKTLEEGKVLDKLCGKRRK